MRTPTTHVWAMRTTWPRLCLRVCCVRGWVPTFTLQGVAYGEEVVHNGVRISLQPAGHVLGSAQVRVEHEGQVWVASGDYRLTPAGALPRSHLRAV